MQGGTVRFLRAYGAEGLNITHLEYARLARSVRDIAARVVNEVDQDGLNTWAFAGASTQTWRSLAPSVIAEP